MSISPNVARMPIADVIASWAGDVNDGGGVVANCFEECGVRTAPKGSAALRNGEGKTERQGEENAPLPSRVPPVTSKASSSRF
jgi:hypothetical protein